MSLETRRLFHEALAAYVRQKGGQLSARGNPMGVSFYRERNQPALRVVGPNAALARDFYLFGGFREPEGALVDTHFCATSEFVFRKLECETRRSGARPRVAARR